MSIAKKEYKKITTNSLQEMKQNGENISMLTAYDYTLAKIVDGAGIDIILVGASASNVMAGHETTLPITLNEIIYHASSVVRAINRCLVVVDMPFGSYQGNSKEALFNAVRIMKETGGHSVKLEGGSEIIESIERILTAGIPVMGHLGPTPQSIYKFGTYTVRAKEEEEAEKLIADADELRLILDGQKEDLEVFRGWRNEIFGKFVHQLLGGKIAFTIKDNKIKKIEL